MTDKKADKFGPDDIPKSKILKIKEYMDWRVNEVVDFMEGKTVEDFIPTGEIYDRLLSQVVEEFPYGLDGRSYHDKVHVILTNALMASLWCGWLSQAMVNKKDPKFKEEYVEQFRRAIMKAFEYGRKYASQRP